jgi:hypothetical protein
MGALFSQRVATRSTMWRRWVCLARYEANGNVAAIEDANSVVTKASYNTIGRAKTGHPQSRCSRQAAEKFPGTGCEHHKPS